VNILQHDYENIVCLSYYENMVNLRQLIGRGRFCFIGLSLKTRGGTGSPMRAVAVFDGENDGFGEN